MQHITQRTNTGIKYGKYKTHINLGLPSHSDTIARHFATASTRDTTKSMLFAGNGS